MISQKDAKKNRQAESFGLPVQIRRF